MTTQGLFSGDRIRELVREVADTLSPEKPQATVLLVEHSRLRVLGAPLSAVFLMKLNRSQPQDVTDMVTLWPLIAETFPTARAVTDAFYAAFPLEETDEHLGSQVVDLALSAGLSLPLN